jgi:hypothetical protein
VTQLLLAAIGLTALGAALIALATRLNHPKEGTNA